MPNSLSTARWQHRLKRLALLLTLCAPILALLSGESLQPVYALDMAQIRATYQKMGGRAQALAEWEQLLHDAKDLSTNDKLKKVNEFFNRHISYAEDIEVWGQKEHWATPMESLSKGRGDCVAYVMSKYFMLRELNVPDKQLRLIYVKAEIGGPGSGLEQAHMVLAYYPTPDAEPQVLDSLITDIRPASRRSDLLPIFSFNSEGIYAGVAGDSAAGPGGVGRLSRWADLLQRAHAEGF